MATSVLASIGDHGFLNEQLPAALAGVWIDRDLSLLDFNDRVLAEALDERTPLLEGAKFLAIFTSNLDEFFMKRVALLRQGWTKSSTRACGDCGRNSFPCCAGRRSVIASR